MDVTATDPDPDSLLAKIGSRTSKFGRQLPLSGQSQAFYCAPRSLTAPTKGLPAQEAFIARKSLHTHAILAATQNLPE